MHCPNWETWGQTETWGRNVGTDGTFLQLERAESLIRTVLFSYQFTFDNFYAILRSAVRAPARIHSKVSDERPSLCPSPPLKPFRINLIRPHHRAFRIRQRRANRPSAPPPQSKNSRRNHHPQNTPVTPSDSALVNHCHSEGLKTQQIQHLRKKWGWVGTLLTKFPKRNRIPALTSSGPIVTLA